MKTLDTIAGHTYVVSSPNGGTVTSADGLVKEDVEAGKQKVVFGTGAPLQLDDEDGKIMATFKLAPAKLMALGLLGGGSTNALPAGYLAAEFLEASGAYVHVPFSFDLSKDEVRIEMATSISSAIGAQNEGYEDGTSNNFAIGQWYSKISVTLGTGIGRESDDLIDGAFYEFWCLFNGAGYSFGENETVWNSLSRNYKNIVSHYNLFSRTTSTISLWKTKRNWWKAFKNGELLFDLIPALDLQGQPVFYNKVDRSKYGNSGKLIVGFTFAQASKLSKLPATGGRLIISLPTGYESDSGVAAALETARSNGWTLTIQTYTPENSTAVASTFALRRVWVRRTQNENGAYVSADGTRWLVDWCVDMLTPDGSTPDQHGYELFRSVDAAVSYWELTPWVDPEAEEMMQNELLNNSTTND